MPDHDHPLLIYGAYGYTGRLIAAEACRRGLNPRLAGRDREKLRRTAEPLGCPSSAFSLDDPAVVVRHLRGARAVLHCAGPYSATAPPMLAACLQAGVHYLDITGEIDTIERAAALHRRAESAGVALLPAVGFDVVPGDCLAALLAAALPSAGELELAFAGTEPLSPGTAQTILENLPRGGRVRREGRIVRVPPAHAARLIPFAGGERWAMSIPWGDVSSAFYSTGIPNITVLTAVPKRWIDAVRRFGFLAAALRLPGAIRLGKWLIRRRLPGPTAAQRQQARAEFWGRVRDPAGRQRQARLGTPGGYRLTVLTAVESAARVLRGEVSAGFATPAQAFGAEYILGFESVEFDWLDHQGPAEK